MARRSSTLTIALTVSALVHAGLLAVRLVDPQAFDRVFQDSALEVILVNARSNEAPVKAQAIAQANLAGGGDAASGRATSPLPPSPPAPPVAAEKKAPTRTAPQPARPAPTRSPSR